MHCLSLTLGLVSTRISAPIKLKENMLKILFCHNWKFSVPLQELSDLNLACFCNPNWWICHPCKRCSKDVWLPPSFDTHVKALHGRLTQHSPLLGQSVSLCPGDQHVETAPSQSAGDKGSAAGHVPTSPSSPPAVPKAPSANPYSPVEASQSTLNL